MKSRGAWLFLRVVAVGLLACCLTGCPVVEERAPVILMTGSRVVTDEFQFHDSLLLDAIGLKPGTEHRVKVWREDGQMVVDLGVTSDRHGRISETVIWYDIGELPYPEREYAMDEDLSEQEMCDFDYAEKVYELHLIEGPNVVHEMTFRVIEDNVRPILYASDSRGIHKPGFLVGEEDVYVVGRNFSSASYVRVWAVPARSEWDDDDPLIDVTNQYAGMPPVFELDVGQNGFKRVLWPSEEGSVGSYDIVAEIITYPGGKNSSSPEEIVERVISYSTVSGFVIQRRPGVGEPLEMEIAGTSLSPFVNKDDFTTDEDVFAGVDPLVQPELIGKTADVYIVPDMNEGGLLSIPSLSAEDVTGTKTSILVQKVCGNCWNTLAWPADLTPGEYDVVLDLNRNDRYDNGIDYVDSLDGPGFTVISEPPVLAVIVEKTLTTANVGQRLTYLVDSYGNAHVAVEVWPGQGPNPFKIELKASDDLSLHVEEKDGTFGSCPGNPRLSVSAPSSIIPPLGSTVNGTISLESGKSVAIEGTITNAYHVPMGSKCYQILVLSFEGGATGEFKVQESSLGTPNVVTGNELRIAVVVYK